MSHHGDPNRKDLGQEHPWGDAGQIFFFLLFMTTWVLDSFFFHFSTFIALFIPYWISIPIAGALLVAAGILVRKSQKVVFEEVRDPPRVINKGVFSRVRHPMYLGFLLFLLGFAVATWSLLSLVVWGAFFLFCNRIATFEERDLERMFGEEYARYRKEVPKWIPRCR